MLSGAHRVQRTREHVTSHAHNINGIIQTWQTFLKIVYCIHGKNYDVRSRDMQLSVCKHGAPGLLNGKKIIAKKDR